MPTPELQSERRDPAEAGGPVRDNAYVMGPHAFVYTTARHDRGFMLRHCAVVLMRVDGRPFEVQLADGRVYEGSVAVVSPLVERRTVGAPGGLVSFNVSPLHGRFRHVSGRKTAPVTFLPREAFAAWDDHLQALFDGEARVSDARVLLKGVLDVVCGMLPPPGASPAPLAPMLAFLEDHPESSLDEMAFAFDATPRRMATLFSTALGMSFRDYKTWLKQRKVLDILYSHRSLTSVAHDAGFTDSPQFARAFQRWFGQSPSFSRDPRHVRVFTPEGTNMARALADAPRGSEQPTRP